MKKGAFLQKLKELLIGKKTLKERILTALCPALCLSFILFFFGPLDLSHIAESYVDYTSYEIFTVCLKTWGITFLTMFFVSWIPGGKLHSWISSLFLGLSLAFYIQGNYLNIDLGTLDGKNIEWQKYGDNALYNLVIFSIIVLIPFLIHFFSRKIWKKFVIFLSLLLIIMQIIPLTITLIKNRPPQNETRYRVLKDKEYVIGKENIIVFILDNTGPEEMYNMAKLYPEALDPFHDFIYFDNFNTEFYGTFPGSAIMLTHQPYDMEIPPTEWFDHIWNANEVVSFYDQLKNNGWTTRAFHSISHAAGKSENEYGKISNIDKVEGVLEYTINFSAFRRLIKLSFYRYFPLIMKAPFRIYTDDLNGMKNVSENEQSWDPYQSVQKYLNNRLMIGDEEKVYISYHYAGAHVPCVLDYDGRYTERTPDCSNQLAGHFYLISEYIQQMKDYDVYDNSTIIITTDHGNNLYPQGILLIKPKGQLQNEMTYSHAPLTQLDFMETIAEISGMEKGNYGQSFFDIPDDEERNRCTGIRWRDPSLPGVPGKSTNAMKIFCYTGDSETVHQLILSDQFEKNIPLPYPWY